MEGMNESALWLKRRHLRLINRRASELASLIEPALRHRLLEAVAKEVGGERDPALVDMAVQDALSAIGAQMLKAVVDDMAE